MDKIKEKIRELSRQPLYTAIAGLVVGLIIGLPILGWGLFPVKWVDADPSYLREDLKKQYVCMVVDSYNVNRDANLAASRLTAMGVEDLKNPKGLFKDLEQGRCNYTNSDPVVMEMKSAFLDIDTGSEETIDPGKPVEGADIPLPQEEIVKEKSENRDATKKEIYDDTQDLAKKVYDYYKKNGFKDFIMLTRYIMDAVYVESQFGGDESD